MFGVAHGMAGKGDKTRVTDNKAYHENLAAIEFPHDNTGFVRDGAKLVKRYGTPQVTTLGDAPAGFVH